MATEITVSLVDRGRREWSATAHIFARLYGVALVAHVVGNWAQPDLPAAVAWVNLAVGLSGVWLAVRPERRHLLITAALVVLSVGLEMPFTGNHWLVAGLVSLAILVTGARDANFVPAGRWILLIFYSFAAFAKLNSGFFDPSVSCALFYGNQSLDGLGIPPINSGSAVALIPIWGTAIVELSVPVLLLWRRTRYLGVVAGSAFHILISFDLNQHFYDFSSVLLALFLLFLPGAGVEAISEAERRLPDRLRRRITLGWVVLAAMLVVIAVIPLTLARLEILSKVPFILWIPFGLLWLVVLIRSRVRPTPLRWKTGLAAAAVVALTFLNGLTPYLEIKTAQGFNMYANLLTARGDSNHFLIRQTLALRDGYADPIEIVSSSDPGLEVYGQRGYLIAGPQFRRYLAQHPEVSVNFRSEGSTTILERGADPAMFSDPGPWWWRFFPLRALDTMNPPRCQDVFLPAL